MILGSTNLICSDVECFYFYQWRCIETTVSLTKSLVVRRVRPSLVLLSKWKRWFFFNMPECLTMTNTHSAIFHKIPPFHFQTGQSQQNQKTTEALQRRAPPRVPRAGRAAVPGGRVRLRRHWGLRRARVKLLAQFTGVSMRMCAVCTAEPCRCQTELYGPFRALTRKRSAFLESLRFFSFSPQDLFVVTNTCTIVLVGNPAGFLLCWLSTLWIISHFEV